MGNDKKSTKVPAPIIQRYIENPNRPGTYDLVNLPDSLNIQYFVLSSPRNDRFKRQGAKIICEAWDKGEKTLFTGLRPLMGSENVFYGNHKRQGQKKSFFCLVQSGNSYEMYYFKWFCPRTILDQMKCLYRYFENQFTPVK